MVVTTTALVAPAVHGPLEFQDVQLDELRDDEALVAIHAVGICHAELSCLHGILPVKFPNVFGHEGAGVVQKVGCQVKGIEPDDTVLLSFNSCGSCVACDRNHPAYCVHTAHLSFGGVRLDGSHTMRTSDGSPLYSNFFGQSSFARLAVVNSRCLIKVLAQTPLDLYAPLGCGMQTGSGAIINTLNLQPGDTVAVFGTGAVGMAAIMAAKIRKAGIIIGIDLDQGRLRLAQELGATHVLDGSVKDIAHEVRTICNGNGVMSAIDTTGSVAVVERMIGCLGPLGRAVTIGAPAFGSRVQIDVISHITMGRQYIGCNQGDSVPQEMVPYLIEQHQNGNFPIEKLVKTYKVEDFAAALEDMKSGKVIKPVLIWPDQLSKDFGDRESQT